MSRSRVAVLWVGLALAACRGEDAYLGGSHEAYRCQTRCEREQGTPSDVGDWFFNPVADLGGSPEVVYPLSGAVHPRDLSQLTVQFRRGRSDFQMFRLRIEAPDSGAAFDFFTPCLSVHPDGCRYLLKGSVWNNARAELLGKKAVLTVTGATALHGVIKTSEPIALDIVESSLGNKGFYYWTTVPLYSGNNESATGIYRLPFGADQAEPFIMPNTKTNARQCGACHSVSRDGSTIAFTARDIDDGPADQRSGSLVTTLTAQPQNHVIETATPGTYDSSMMALSGNGKRVLVAYDEQLVLRSSEAGFRTGEVIASLSKEELGGKVGYFPEFSPSDDAVALTLSDTPDSAIAVQAGDIAVIDVDLAASTSTFGKPRTIVPGNDDIFHFYPTWSPQGDYIAFASAPRGTNPDGTKRKSYDQKLARLRLVRSDGTGTVYELANATQREGKWSTYPKFAPFQSGSISFLTFNSKMSYGLIQDNDAKADSDRVAQLWMSAVDPSKLPADPSSPPIWLPFQDATQPGHLGLWTNEVKCRTDVPGTGCDIGQKCVQDVCIVEPK